MRSAAWQQLRAGYPIHTYHTAKDDFPMLPSAPLHTPPLHTMAPHMSQSPSSRSHHVQPEANPNQNMFQHQNYPYPNFSLGHRSPSFGTCATSRPEVSATSRVPASCLQGNISSTVPLWNAGPYLTATGLPVSKRLLGISSATDVRVWPSVLWSIGATSTTAPTHNNFVHSGHHAPSFSNVIPPLTFPMHEH
ncbi:hypothetical protein MRX96_038347 [Rhipicephalus microplus]